jgi:hypothetical protein
MTVVWGPGYASAETTLTLEKEISDPAASGSPQLEEQK